MISTKQIPPPPNRTIVVKQDATTNDIMQLVLERCKEKQAKGFILFCNQFTATKKGVLKLFNFMLNNFKYVFDGFKFQDVQGPLQLNKTRTGDCKSFTVFATNVFKYIGITCRVKFTSYDKGNFTHVYNEIKINGKWEPFDVVYKVPFQEAKFIKSKIYDMPQLRSIGRVNNSVSEPNFLINQKVKNIPPVDVSFTEGLAELTTLRNQARIMQQVAIKKTSRKNYQAAESLLDKVIEAAKSGKSVNWGLIPDSLQALAAAAKSKLKLTMPALNPMVSTISMQDAKRLEGLQRIGKIDNIERCAAAPNLFLENGIFKYGSGTKYQLSESEAMQAIIRARDKYGFTLRSTKGGIFKKPVTFYCFNSEIDKNRFLKEIGEWSGVFQKYLNNLFEPNGKAGCATLYNFINSGGQSTSTATSGGGGGKGEAAGDRTGAAANFNLNELPNIVTTKTAIQNEYLQSIGFFSGSTRSLLLGLSRNTILPVSGGAQPEAALNQLVSNGNNSSVGAIPIAAVLAIASAVLGAISKITEATESAKETDAAAAAASQLKGISEQNAFDETDFQNGGQSGGQNGGQSGGQNGGQNGGGRGGQNGGRSGGQNGGGFSNYLPLAAGAAALYFLIK